MGITIVLVWWKSEYKYSLPKYSKIDTLELQTLDRALTMLTSLIVRESLKKLMPQTILSRMINWYISTACPIINLMIMASTIGVILPAMRWPLTLKILLLPSNCTSNIPLLTLNNHRWGAPFWAHFSFRLMYTIKCNEGGEIQILVIDCEQMKFIEITRDNMNDVSETMVGWTPDGKIVIASGEYTDFYIYNISHKYMTF